MNPRGELQFLILHLVNPTKTQENGKEEKGGMILGKFENFQRVFKKYELSLAESFWYELVLLHQIFT